MSRAAYMKAYRAAHPEKWRQTPIADCTPSERAYRRRYQQQYRAAHRDKRREYNRRAYQKRKLRKLRNAGIIGE